MSIVTLVSGGLDSSLMAVLAAEAGVRQFPLFVDYGQRARDRELAAYQDVAAQRGLPDARVLSIPGYGKAFPSALTQPGLRPIDDAFLPGRNLVLLVFAAAYASSVGAGAVAIGLLNDAYSLFPDQTTNFVRQTEITVSIALGLPLRVLAPFMTFSKAQVAAIARAYDLTGTYSCHLGGELPCGQCISCGEYNGLEV